MSDDAIPYISSEVIFAACTMRQAIEAMRIGFSELSSGGAHVPIRTHVALPRGGDLLFMPSSSETLERHAVKVASVHPDNPARDLELVQATVLHFDSQTGKPIAVLEGRAITAIRTGAGSGLATELMARKNAAVAVVVGAGTQAETQLEAVCSIRQIERAYCISRSPRRAEVFADRMTNLLGLDVVATADTTVMKEADIICTATTSSTPVLSLKDVRPGVHVNAVGAHRPHATEIDPDLVRASRVIVDHRDSCLKEAGEILLPIEAGFIAESHILGELGELALGRFRGRTTDDEITLFKSVGNAIQDLYLAEFIVNNII